MDIEKYLEKWKNDERQKWRRYNEYLDRFIEVKRIMELLPAPDKFASNILEMLKEQKTDSLANKDAIIEIFSRKSPSSWAELEGIERVSQGNNDYIEFLENELGEIDQDIKLKINSYLEQLNKNIRDLINKTFATHAARGNTFRIINGNKYIRILSLIQFIRTDDREELAKYRYASGVRNPSEGEYKDPYLFRTLGHIIFELYGIANLIRDKVYIYNSRIALSKFGYKIGPPIDFAGLFIYMNEYDLFARDKYKDYFLDKDEKFTRKVQEILTQREVENLLRHIEIDQFFSSYEENEKKEEKERKRREGGYKEKSSAETAPLAVPVKPEQHPFDPVIPKNIILHGPVGTGKTLIATILATQILGVHELEFSTINELLTKDLSNRIIGLPKSERVQILTFHQSYGYEEFIQGLTAQIKPDTNDLEYVVKPGKFVTFCRRAKTRPDERFVIIIDEINRGDISRIFGELITLVEDDKRCNIRNPDQGLTISLPRVDEFGEDGFCVPDNVYIIGTMNDSDRSIALLDIALRRRFTFYEVKPNEDLLSSWMKNNENITLINDFEKLVVGALKGLNKRIALEKSKDYGIGHAFFIDLKNCTGDPVLTIQLIFRHKLIPLLEEFFYGEENLLHKRILKDTFYIGENRGDYTLDEDVFTNEGKERFLDCLVKLKREENE